MNQHILPDLAVLGIVEDAVPGLGQGVEEAVRVVEAAALQLQVQRGKGLLAQQPEEHDPRVAVVRAVVKRRRALLEPLAQRPATRRIQRSHRRRQVAKHGGVGEIEAIRLPVGNHPGHDGVLRQIRVAAAGRPVKLHQVVKVGQPARQPPLRRLPIAERRKRRPNDWRTCVEEKR